MSVRAENIGELDVEFAHENSGRQLELIAGSLVLDNEVEVVDLDAEPSDEAFFTEAESQVFTDSGDSLSNYLDKANRIPLLTASEEVDLAKRIEAGVEARSQLEDDELDANQIELLESLVVDGQVAKEHFIKANLRLVYYIARKFIGNGLDLPDLVQEGNIGLNRAVEKFDWHRGFKFSTYATWWIRQSIARAINDQARTIRLPVHKVEDIRRMQRTRRNLMLDLKRDPTVQEVAEALGVKVSKVNEMMLNTQLPVSLDMPVDHEEGTDNRLGDFIADPNVIDLDERLDKEIMKEQIRKMLKGLTTEEKQIITLRFGLNGEPEQSSQEVGRQFGVSGPTIQRRQKEALLKMRRHKNADTLKDIYFSS